MRRPASTQRKGIRQSPSRRVDLLSVRLAPRRHSRFRGLTYEVLEDRRLLAGTHNIVVAAAGDSYSSGEGNPAVSAWAEDNTNRGTATWLVGSTEEETAGNTLAHRSPFAASYVLYKDLEERLRQVDPQASVTFAFASAAGATIENSVMNPYAGVSYENVDPNYTPLPKQIQQIRQISTSPVVGKQPIDVLTLSFGGNDIGFGNIARSLLLIDDLLFPFSHDTLLKLLKKAVETGESEHWRALKASLLLPESLVALDTILAVYGQVFPVAPGATIVWDLIVDIALPDESIDHDIAGLNHLNDWYDDNHVYHQGAYGQLNKEIADNLVLPSTKNIYITEYPSPFLVLDENGKEVEVEVLDDVIPGLECSATEAKWLKTNVIDRLNEAVKTASEKYNWTYVGGVGGIEDAFVGHDYGGDGGYYTTSGWWPFTSEDYLAMGGNPLLPHTRGILHPNKDGHEAIADQLFSAVTSKPTIESNNQGSFPATDIHVEFNKDMDDSTFTNASVTVTGSSSGTHTCAFTFDPSTYDLRINPTSDFSYGERVTVKIGAAVTNRFGVALNSPYQYSFDVASRTYIVSAGTGPHGNISPSGPLTLAQGANQTFTAAADSGYVVDTWYLDGQPVKSGGNSYTLANLQGSLSVVVTFRIDTSSGEITLKSPNGGGVYAQGRRMGINWEALRTGGEVKIELLKGGVVSTVIAQSAANSGSYSWQVPNDQSLGSDYRIRVTSLSVLASDASDSDFQIVVKPPPSNDPRDISSLSQLQALQAHWGDLDHPTDGYYRLTNDIDAEATSQWNGGLGFKPIGTGYSDYFRGVFDGQGYRISGLQIKRSGEALVGLFALCMDVGIIKNLFLECRQIEGQGPMPGNDGGVGALVGLNAGTIINCHVTVREGNDLRSYGGKVGGIVGENFRGLIRNCSFTGDIEGRLGGAGGDSNRVGGIAGVNDGTIVWCWTQGTVDGDYSNSKGDHVGGIAGDNFGLIRECYSSSRYIQGQYYVGGIVGYNASGGMIADCYYTGSTVSASIGAGGIVGYQDGGGTVQRCYVTGGIQGGSERGALIGRNWDTVRDCFWDIQTTGYPTTPVGNMGGTIVNCQGKTTAEMKQQATFTTSANWDFTSVWTIEENTTYPELRGIGVNLASPTGVNATEGQRDGVHISWNAVTDALAYRVYRSETLISTPSRLAPLSEWGSELAFIDETAVPDITYYYWVTAAGTINGARESDLSSSDSGSRSLPPLTTPTNVTASNDSDAGVLLQWDAAPNANYYHVYRALTETSGKTPIGSWQGGLSLFDTSATPDTVYYYWATAAVDQLGERESNFGPAVAGMAPVAPPSLTITDGTILEGTSGTASLGFMVTLSAAATHDVTVSYATADGTATTADSDYQFINGGTLTIFAGQTTGTITVSVSGDSRVEPDENFYVNLSSASGATISDNQGQGTILSDDATIAGTIWDDADRDGLRDSGEAGLSGWTVYLDANNNSTFDTGETSVTSDASGSYSFTLNTGAYKVREVVQNDWQQTTPVGGVYAVTLTAGQNVTGKDFGNNSDEPQSLVVSSFLATSTGFVAQFNRGIETSVLNLYDQGNQLGVADVEMTGATGGPVRGSLVLGPAATQVRFIKTGGLLEPDSYTVRLRSGANGFRDPVGHLLDGDGNGTTGDDFVRTFSVDPGPVDRVTVTLPDFARGYGQPVNLPANDLTAGVPLGLSSGLNVSGIDLKLGYDPALLQVESFVLDSLVGARGASSLLTFPSPGTAILTISAPVSFAASSGSLTLGRFIVRVPDHAPYGAKHVLDIFRLHVFDATINVEELPSVDDDAIHVASYFGDTNASRTYNAPDVTLVQRIIGQINTGLATFQLADPRLVSDVTLNGAIQANDVTSIQRVIGQVTVPNVPSLPEGIVTPPPVGADPKLFIPQDLSGTAGSTVTVPISLRVTETGGITISGMDVVIEFDPAKFTVGNAQIGNLLTGSGFSGLLTNPEPGKLVYTASSASGTRLLTEDTEGTLFTLDFTIVEGTSAGSSSINLLSSYRTTVSSLFDNNLNALVLDPAPTNAASDAVDGKLTIGGGIQTGTIAGAVWKDADGDGIRDTGETGLSGWTVYLDTNNNSTFDTGETFVTSDASGNYSFTLNGGSYNVRDVVQNNWQQTAPAGGVYAVTLTAGQNVTGKDFGSKQLPATIAGTIWNDGDADGLHDTGEAGLSGWTVYLDTNNSNTFDTGETSVTSDANGNYGFTLNAGSYNVREVVQNNWQQTAPAGGVYAVTLTAGQNVAGKDFGNRQLSATITGTIWNDGDADGLHDTGEAGLSGWTVYLDTNNNNTFDTGETSVTSDASGNYSFTLNAGSYNVREVVQSNWRQTAPVGGVYAVTLTAGQNVAGKDFGVAPNGSQLTITYNSTIATSGSVSGIALSPDDTRLYAAYWEDSPTSRVRQYNLPDGQLLQTINFGSYHTHGDVVISADGNRIFTSNYYYDTVSQVDLANSNIITNQSTVDSWPGRVDIAPDRTKVLAAVGWDGRNYDMNNDSIAVYNIASGAFNRVASVKLNDEPQSAIGFSADSQYAYVGTRKRKSGSATLYEIALSGQPALTRSLPFAGVEILRAVVVASDKVFVSSAEQAKIWVVSRSSWTVISEITLPEGPSVLKMHPSGNYLFASLPNAKSVIAMDVASGQIVARYDGLQTAPSDIEFNSNGNKVYVSHITADGNVMVFDVSFGNAQWPWHNFDNPFDVDGQDVVSALDVLIMINYINFNLGQTTLPSAPVEPHPFYDVNADNACTGSDVLMVINYINSRSPGAAGEGEAAAVTLVYSSEHLSAAAQRPAANAVLPQTADWRDVESEQEDAALAAWSLVVDAEADSAGDRGPARGNHDGKKSAQLDINVLEDVLEIDTVLTAIAGDVARGWNRIP